MKIVLLSDTHYHRGGIGFNKNAYVAMFQDIKEEEADCIIHAGDWGETIYDVKECTGLLREAVGKYTPIIGVWGNHDYWGIDRKKQLNHLKQPRDLQEHMKLLSLIGKQRRIKRKIAFYRHKVLLIAWNGWYGYTNPPSNDARRIKGIYKTKEEKMYDLAIGKPFNIHEYMKQREQKRWQRALKRALHPDFIGWKKVLVTHFNLSVNTASSSLLLSMSGMVSKFQECKELGITHICYGHTHKKEERVVDGITLLNCGADYGSLSYITFDI